MYIIQVEEMSWVAAVVRNPLILVCTGVYYSGQGGELGRGVGARQERRCCSKKSSDSSMHGCILFRLRK